MNTLIFMGHPGHELLAYKFIGTEKPYLVYLTTGSGHADQSRISQSISLAGQLGVEVLKPFEPFTDKEVYSLIMNKDHQTFKSLKDALQSLIIDKKIDRIVGDALEGFNPSHDLCRYIVNSVVLELSNEKKLLNYQFLQDQLYNNDFSKLRPDDFMITLEEAELEEKINACRSYDQLKFEVDRFIGKYGTDYFRHEYFTKVDDPRQLVTWDEEYPFYESHGRKRVAEGIYKQAIIFEEHMKPIAEELLS